MRKCANILPLLEEIFNYTSVKLNRHPDQESTSLLLSLPWFSEAGPSPPARDSCPSSGSAQARFPPSLHCLGSAQCPVVGEFQAEPWAWSGWAGAGQGRMVCRRCPAQGRMSLLALTAFRGPPAVTGCSRTSQLRAGGCVPNSQAKSQLTLAFYCISSSFISALGWKRPQVRAGRNRMVQRGAAGCTGSACAQLLGPWGTQENSLQSSPALSLQPWCLFHGGDSQRRQK